MRLEEIVTIVVFVGIPFAIAVMTRTRRSKSLDSKAKKHIKEAKQEQVPDVVHKNSAPWFDESTLAENMRPSFEYSEEELKFRRDIDLIQRGINLSNYGSFRPEGLDQKSYQEINQRNNGYNYPWLKVYDAFFDNKRLDDNYLSVESDGSTTQILLNGEAIVTKEVVGDFNGLLDVITLSDCGNKSFETISYINRIIAAYGHNIIVDDAKVNPRYGRLDVGKEAHHSESLTPWRIKNAFSKSGNIQMIDWSGDARIEVAILKDYFHPKDEYSLCLKTTFYMADSDNPLGTMHSNVFYSIDDFNYFYKK